MLTGLEGGRKLLHIAMGGFALLLRFLTWQQAALCAVIALAFNLFVLPRVSGNRFSRESDVNRGYPIEILLYPVTVLLLILLFRDNLAIAAAGWAFLAFGDGMATVVSLIVSGPRLAWNREKSWPGLLGNTFFGGLAAVFLYFFTARQPVTAAVAAAILIAAAIAAAVETLPSEIDDNLLPPILGASALASLLVPIGAGLDFGPRLSHQFLIGIGVNAVISLVAFFIRLVRPSGVWSGFLAGTVIYGFGGWKAYLVLWFFFAVGTAATHAGKKRKEAMGKVEEAGGRRGAAHVFANVSVAAFLVSCWGLSGGFASPLFLLAATAAFATALMDTIGTEVGQAIASPTFLLPEFRPVPPGTDGAVSIVGTLAGLLAATALGGLAGWFWDWPPSALTAIVAGAFAGTAVESLLGREGAAFRVSNGHVLNFLNTIVGAVTGWLVFTSLVKEAL